MFQIRILEQKDAASYRELRLKSYQESPFAFSESYEDEVKKSLTDFQEELKVEGTPPEQFILGVYTPGDELAGFVKFRRDKRSKARHKSMIHAMYIGKDYRNQQLGKMLIDDLIGRVSQLEGLEQIHLWVLHSQRSASDFYSRCGFESQGPFVKKDLKVNGAYVDAEYMVMYFE